MKKPSHPRASARAASSATSAGSQSSSKGATKMPRAAAPPMPTTPDPTCGGRPAALRDASAAPLPADGHHLVAHDDRRHLARVAAVLHQLGAPVVAGRRVALLELEPVGAQRLARLLAVGAVR